jgi:hypothetical protein
MRRPITQLDSPGIESIPQKEHALIGGRAETWTLPHPRNEDDRFEPNIVRGRD